MRDSCLQQGPSQGRVELRLSPRLGVLLLELHKRKEGGAVRISLPAARARRLLRTLAEPPGPLPLDAPTPLELAELQRAIARALAPPPSGAHWERDARGSLTAREQEVLAALAAGHSYAEIARDLVIEVETVRSHAKRIRRKLGVSSSSQLRGWTDARVEL